MIVKCMYVCIQLYIYLWCHMSYVIRFGFLTRTALSEQIKPPLFICCKIPRFPLDQEVQSFKKWFWRGSGAWGQHSPDIHFWALTKTPLKRHAFFWSLLKIKKQFYTVKCMFLLCSEGPKSEKHTFYTVKYLFFQFWNEISRFQT